MPSQLTSTYADELKTQMDKQLLLLQKKKASEEEIKKCRRVYLSEIKKARRREKKEKQQARAFLRILNKENCTITEHKIRKHFFTFISAVRTSSTPLLAVKAIWAMQALAKGRLIKTVLQTDGYKKRRNKLLNLKKALAEVASLMGDSDVGDFYTIKAERDDEVSIATIMSDHAAFYKQVCRRGFELDLYLTQDKERGRPADKDFYSFVYHVAKTYEEISGKKFTLDKHKGTHGSETGKYLATTPGHRFVCEAVAWMHKEFADPDIKKPLEYTNINTYHACEKALKKLRNK